MNDEEFDRRNTDKYNELILEELRGIKSEFISMRVEISGIKKDMLEHTNSCGIKHAQLGDTFIHGITFWKVLGLMIFFITGGYAYTTIIYNILKS